MANADPEPWTPDPSTAPGTPPVGGTGGERGTSSFAGNSLYNADGTRKPGTAAPGPDVGVAYFTDGVVLTSGISANVLGESTLQARTLTVVVAADDTTPAALAPVVLTATVTPGAVEEPSGTVTFLDGATELGSIDLAHPTDTAELTVTDGFAAGAHTITARFDGDADYPATTSAGITVTAS